MNEFLIMVSLMAPSTHFASHETAKSTYTVIVGTKPSSEFHFQEMVEWMKHMDGRLKKIEAK